MHAASETAFVVARAYIYIYIHHYAITKHPLIPLSTCAATSVPRPTRGEHPLLRRNKAREGRESPRGNRTRQSTRARPPFRKYSRAVEGRISANRRKLPPGGWEGGGDRYHLTRLLFTRRRTSADGNVASRRKLDTCISRGQQTRHACHAFFNPPSQRVPSFLAGAIPACV